MSDDNHNKQETCSEHTTDNSVLSGKLPPCLVDASACGQHDCNNSQSQDLSDCILIEDTCGDIDEVIHLIQHHNDVELERYLEIYTDLDLNAYSTLYPGINPVISACICGSTNCLQTVLKYGGKAKMISKDGLPPIFYAIKYKQFDVALYLLNECDGSQSLISTHVDGNGDDMLLMCLGHLYRDQTNEYISQKGLAVFRLLLKQGSFAVSHRNKAGQTVEELASQYRMQSVVDALFNGGPKRRPKLSQWLFEKLLFFIHEQNVQGLVDFHTHCVAQLNISPEAISHVINKSNSHGLCAVHAVAVSGHTLLLDTIIRLGGDVIGCFTHDQKSLVMFLLDTVKRNIHSVCRQNASGSMRKDESHAIPHQTHVDDTGVDDSNESCKGLMGGMQDHQGTDTIQHYISNPLSPQQVREHVEPQLRSVIHLLTVHIDAVKHTLHTRDNNNSSIFDYLLAPELQPYVSVELVIGILRHHTTMPVCPITHSTLFMDIVNADIVYNTHLLNYQEHYNRLVTGDGVHCKGASDCPPHSGQDTTTGRDKGQLQLVATTTATTTAHRHQSDPTHHRRMGRVSYACLEKAIAHYTALIARGVEVLRNIIATPGARLGQMTRSGWCAFDLLITNGTGDSVDNDGSHNSSSNSNGGGSGSGGQSFSAMPTQQSSEAMIQIVFGCFIEHNLLDITHHCTGSLWDKAVFMKQHRKVEVLRSYRKDHHVSTNTKDSVVLGATKVVRSLNLGEVYMNILLPPLLRSARQ